MPTFALPKRSAARWAVPALAALALPLLLAGHAHAQSSLGIGVNDGGVPPATGLFAHWMNWINVRQQEFYRSLAAALKAMRDDKRQMWWMVGLSFAYGVFHAAGPGHGKAVISSYMLANEVTLKRGILLSFISAFLQAATAILVMTLAFLVLRGTAVTMTDATRFLEIASYALITAFGAWLLWKKLAPRIAALFAPRPLVSLSAAAVGDRHAHAHHHGHQHGHGEACGCGHDHAQEHNEEHGDGDAPSGGNATAEIHHLHLHHHAHEDVHLHHDHAHVAGEVCTTCGHAHAPDPAAIAGDDFNWKTAWSAVMAVGLRPCSGALIVLSFAFLNGLYAGGVLSVLAMALGTAITVSLLATLAVTAKGFAMRLAGEGRAGAAVHTAIEIGGAALVFLVGLTLVSASLAA